MKNISYLRSLEVAEVFSWNFLSGIGSCLIHNLNSMIALALDSIQDLISASECWSREKLRTKVHGARKILRAGVLVESVAMLHSSDSVSGTRSGFLLRGRVNSSGGACLDCLKFRSDFRPGFTKSLEEQPPLLSGTLYLNACSIASATKRFNVSDSQNSFKRFCDFWSAAFCSFLRALSSLRLR